MPLSVSDRSSNKQEQIVHAAEVLGRSSHKQKVFQAIYTGKRKVKIVPELMKITQLSHKRVLEAGKELYDQCLVEQVKVGKLTGYKKIGFFQSHRDRILRAALNSKERDKIPTKRRPSLPRRGNERIQIELKIPAKKQKAQLITVDDIESFGAVRSIQGTPGSSKIPECRFKKGIAKILGEKGCFKDWGGESSDLVSTRVHLDGRRRSAAFAFKGPGTSGKLTPAKMGKNGDQIQRLMKCPADVFLIQYCGQIGEAVLEQLEKLAKCKSYMEDRPIWYCAIDGGDSARLICAYPDAFGAEGL